MPRLSIVGGADAKAFGLFSQSSGYNQTRSLRFRASASASLSRTPASGGDQTKWTFSRWVKRGALGSINSLFYAGSGSTTFTEIRFESDDTLRIVGFAAGTKILDRSTVAVYRDPSAYYHVVISCDTANGTAANRQLFYVNGVQVTSITNTTLSSLNDNTRFNSTAVHYINFSGAASAYGDNYAAEHNWIDGQALTPSSFGSFNSTTGVWQPAQYTGTYGTNGFYLPFTDNSALTTSSNVGLGKDFSGNGNYWTTNNISITAGVTYDSMTDVPTLTSSTAANFAVMNPVTPNNFTLTNGNLSVFKPNVGAQSYNSRSTIAVNSGKWYVEFTVVGAITGAGAPMLGITNPANSSNAANLTSFSNTFVYYGFNGFLYNNGSGAAYGATYGANDVIGMALDLNAGTLTFYKNNVSQGVATSSIAGQTFIMLVNDDQGLNSWTVAVNYGQCPFTYTPPTGFVALNTYNLPDSTIKQGNKVMDATLWAGNNASPQAITNAGSFQPDLVWVKSRTTSGYWNVLFDSVRGAGNQLSSNQTDAELASVANVAGKVSAFNTNGFNLTTGLVSTNSVNASANNYVGWQWQAGAGSSSSNTNGTITSTVSVNASAGFSVVTWAYNSSGGTIGHGLGVAPQLIIQKDRTNGTYNWDVYHASLGATQRISLNSTNATQSQIVWNNTAPTSSVFSSGASWYTNADAIVSYCWTPIAGYSAFGSYTGNGSADGPFVYTGMRTRWVMIKRTDTAGTNWNVYDTSRDPYNVELNYLAPNLSDAENATGTSATLDGLSNGIKIRNSGSFINASGGTYIYAAFAENPTKYALAR